jgi:hypothetical protein
MTPSPTLEARLAAMLADCPATSSALSVTLDVPEPVVLAELARCARFSARPLSPLHFDPSPLWIYSLRDAPPPASVIRS